MPAIYFLDQRLSDSGTAEDWRREWLRMLGADAKPLVWNEQGFVSEDTSLIAPGDIVVAHDNPDVFRIADGDGRASLCNQANDGNFYVVFVSGDYARDEDRLGLPANGYRRYQPVSARGFDASFARCFERFWKDLCAKGVEPNFGLLEPDNPSPLALRLLCEAWLVVNDQGTSECNGIPIQAPSTIEEWLAPFGRSPTSVGVAALMGEAKGAAMNLFDAIERPKDNNVKDAVSAYLAAVASKQ